ncbi:hypothetical protein TTHERM_00894470 (macronuclear) [Tetrahymena thermophila SB210]|uniref:Uncharacterized protein n=1 Tax=Tetrahymena thermophila (strain SB210) TaxID=312017 RepID=Q23U47_TETTS|nr:hypothetical protein TTHERM_00894470 [Tetrahymena thermophila SB210]EAS00097.1 hypothetical protein TTHERM_00894470 [Tetrahymena thermophila SB210]|eukprot:XP_001020342.1 hypothetical protein TTHERM_00894470 [Tetrahymena thermophila SB210]
MLKTQNQLKIHILTLVPQMIQHFSLNILTLSHLDSSLTNHLKIMLNQISLVRDQVSIVQCLKIYQEWLPKIPRITSKLTCLVRETSFTYFQDITLKFQKCVTDLAYIDFTLPPNDKKINRQIQKLIQFNYYSNEERSKSCTQMKYFIYSSLKLANYFESLSTFISKSKQKVHPQKFCSIRSDFIDDLISPYYEEKLYVSRFTQQYARRGAQFPKKPSEITQLKSALSLHYLMKKQNIINTLIHNRNPYYGRFNHIQDYEGNQLD